MEIKRGEWYTLDDGYKARVKVVKEENGIDWVVYEVFEMKLFEGQTFPEPLRLYETADDARIFEDMATPWDGPVVQ